MQFNCKSISAFSKLLTIKQFCRDFVEKHLGAKYVENRGIEFIKTFEESSKSTPLFFVLSPGVDPLKDVEALGWYNSPHFITF